MADRYWVLVAGGTWNGVNTGKWSTTSGSGTGAAEPTTSDNVFFDGNSGVGTVTIQTTAAQCANLDFTGFGGTLAGSTAMNCNGSFKAVAGMGFTYTGMITFGATAAGQLLTTAGKSMPSVVFNGVGGVWTMQDAWSAAVRSITLTNGHLNTNGQAVSIRSLSSANTNVRALTLGASVVTFDGGNTQPVNFGATVGESTPFTFSGASATFLINIISASTWSIDLNGKAPGVLTLQGAGLGIARVRSSGANITMGTIRDTRVGPRTIQFSAGMTYSIAVWDINGIGGNPVTLQSTSAGNPATLAYTGVGVVSAVNLIIRDSTATPAFTWFDRGLPVATMNVSGNTGWVFSARRALTATRTAIVTARAVAATRTLATARTSTG